MVDFTHILNEDVVLATRTVPAGTKVQLRGSRRDNGVETVLLRMASTWKAGGEFVTTYHPGLLTRLEFTSPTASGR